MKSSTPKAENTAHVPYSLSPKAAATHFGFSPSTIYDLISRGKLCRGLHYLKVGKKVVIIREKFIQWMTEQDGVIPYGN